MKKLKTKTKELDDDEISKTEISTTEISTTEISKTEISTTETEEESKEEGEALIPISKCPGYYPSLSNQSPSSSEALPCQSLEVSVQQPSDTEARDASTTTGAKDASTTTGAKDVPMEDFKGVIEDVIKNGVSADSEAMVGADERLMKTRQ